MTSVEQLAGHRVLVVNADGRQIRDENDAADLIGEALSADASWVAAPLSRLVPDALKLETRVLGLLLQKFVNYRIGFAMVGDISDEVAASRSLHDFVHESNLGRQVWFVPDMAALAERLAT